MNTLVFLGKSRAVRVLQAAICGKGTKIAIDGGIGPQTIQASLKSGLEVNRLRSYRVKYYADLISRKPKLEKYWYGWYRRALEV
jgi:lysozyme family protein